MRKRLVAAVMAVALLAVGASAAYAENQYEVDIATTSPVGKGTAAKPLPVKLGFGYEVTDSDGLRPTVITQYKIAPEGLITYSGKFPSCTYAQAGADAPYESLPAKCRNAAKVGGGIVRNAAGGDNDRTQMIPCNLKLTLINLSDAGKNGGMAIRLDGDQPLPVDPLRDFGCALPIHRAIKATFHPVKLDGLPTHELRFTVPDQLLHPLGGTTNSVIDVTSTVLKRTTRARVKGKRRTVGFYSEVGCKGPTRTVRVLFVDENRDQFTAKKQAKC